MSNDVKTLREEHADATRLAVLEAAERAFATQGYGAASLDRIAASARLTKGAVYHHFKDKRALFREVYRRQAQRVLDRVVTRLTEATTPLDQLLKGIDAFLECGRDEVIREVLFVQGPAVLSGECRQIDQEFFLGLLLHSLAAFEAEGATLPGDRHVVATLLLGVLIEAAQLLGRSDDFEATRAELAAILPKMLPALLSG